MPPLPETQLETELEAVARSVMNAERHVARQGQIVYDLRAKRHDTRLAEQLLRTFERALGAMRDHLELIEREVRESKTRDDRGPV
jgi:hypothetical protein